MSERTAGQASPVETLGPVPGAGSVLVVAPSASAVSPAGVVGGLPLITRIVRAAKAAGYEQIFVCDMGPGIRRLAEGAGAVVLTPSPPIPHRSRRRTVVVPANVVPQPRWLRSLLDMPTEPELLYLDGASVVVVETERSHVVIAAAARAASAAGLVSELSRVFEPTTTPLAPDGRFPLGSAGDVARAETWLLRSLIKHNEGFMSRHFERRISLALTRRLASTSVTPNVMTLTSLAIGLAGAPFFLSAAPALQLTGALLFLVHSVLDGCDGELARLKFLQSRGGAILDFWGDNTVHVAVFVCIAVGWSLSAGTAEDRAVSANSPAAARLAAKLANRDFIYLVVVLSAFGKASWFLAVVAVGAPAFLLVVLWSERRHGRFR
ncbi:MAG: hypothetical protein AUH30_07035 [Candidatus Rokubacteria bacterium 13_1_40CM_68_15]|nr:MAG: hypothetical protein AUH30_07035 [Candidatus Rokubacteria bacterium 13_1_40CM_68_15]